MTPMTVPPNGVRKYGIDIYEKGKLTRTQVITAGTAAIAEVKVRRYLADGEYAGCVVPRLIKDAAAVIDLPIDARDAPNGVEGEVAA